jgi:hypothetical protein
LAFVLYGSAFLYGLCFMSFGRTKRSEASVGTFIVYGATIFIVVDFIFRYLVIETLYQKYKEEIKPVQIV